MSALLIRSLFDGGGKGLGVGGGGSLFTDPNEGARNRTLQANFDKMFFPSTLLNLEVMEAVEHEGRTTRWEIMSAGSTTEANS